MYQGISEQQNTNTMSSEIATGVSVLIVIGVVLILVLAIVLTIRLVVRKPSISGDIVKKDGDDILPPRYTHWLLAGLVSLIPVIGWIVGLIWIISLVLHTDRFNFQTHYRLKMVYDKTAKKQSRK